MKLRSLKALKRYETRREAQRHLEHFAMDRHPAHILEAVYTLCAAGERLDGVMLGNLRHAIRMVGRPKDTTARAADIERAALAAYAGRLPRRLTGTFVAETARTFHTTPANVKTVLSRARDRRAGRGR